MGNPIAISIHTPKSTDLPTLSRLDIAANASHPLISQSFTYPFQALKLFLAHLQFCFERPATYRICVARLSTRCHRGSGEGNLKLTRSGSADSGVDVSPIPPDSLLDDGDDDDATGEVIGFMMWKIRTTPTHMPGEESDDWDWTSQLPKGTDMKLWKRYTEVMSSDTGIGEGDIEILKLAVLPRYQGRGVGTRLLQTFLRKVEIESEAGPGLPDDEKIIRVRASRSAKALYEKLGWRMVNQYTLDLREWGRARAYIDFEMVRDA
ncbi:hypothetical protein VTL71DRAFT_15611 [Oculimacula yallundae]|uniref:N-acetyltransferase domain-containing protein n=1 Tax=Oculimacula yallundae TaxID=86028 RepID=A0ABR4CH36_9HELO